MANEGRGDLQFDRAEFAAAQPTETRCAACGQAIWDTYYEIGGQIACERCKTDAELKRSEGSGPGRFVRATLYGTGAGVVGAGIWYAVRAVTDYEVGLIAILVGLMVGGAVKKGSGGRGGWLYQSLAIFLTYASIVSTYIPIILKIATDQKPAAQSAPASGSAPAKADPAVAPAATPPLGAPAAPVAAEPQNVSFVRFLMGVGALFALALALPFLMGFQNIMGLVIIGIGLYEAWKINKRVVVEITGPYRVGAAPPPRAAGV
jgi:hypothetical protein